MKPPIVNLKQKLTLFDEHWSPKVIAALNDYEIKVVKVQGDFVWHSHPETDELFYVIAGQLDIEYRDHTATLHAGDMQVIPAGIEHRTVAQDECHIMLIEPAGVVNTGDADPNHRTAVDEKI